MSHWDIQTKLKGWFSLDPIDYYNKNASLYFENTVGLNMQEILEEFIKYLPEGATVLDLGCGSGRDSLYFIEKGFDTTALDGAQELCELASIHIGQNVLHMQYSELDFTDVFDGIWACASLLHLQTNDINDVLQSITKALKPHGLLYMSFKHGDFNGILNGRYFNCHTTRSLKNLMESHKELEVLELWMSQDVRPEREEDSWLNIIVRKIKDENQE